MLGSLIAGRFRLGPRIGAGTAGAVHQAVDVNTGVEVAVKLATGRHPLDDTRRRFEREAAALSVLSSPHVVGLIAAGQERDGRPYLVLELLRGATLQQELATHGALAPPDVARWLGETAAALELAHGMGIVHRDLKPSNLFLHRAGPGRTLKILDFGLVTDRYDPTSRGAGEFVGTPLYMAPEQVRGQAARVGPATDVWALAMVAIVLLTGEPYWSSASVDEVVADIDGAPLYPPSVRWPWLTPAFDAWFARSTQRVPERRWRNVAEQVTSLGVALRSIAVHRAAAAAASMGDASTAMARTPTPAITRSFPAEKPLVGRQVERLAACASLAPGAFVTLVGPGGVGKSRLAAAVVASQGDELPDGAWLVRLGGVADGAGIAGALAQALGLEADTTRAQLDQVAAALAPRRALVVLDGAEHLIAARDVFAELARRAPAVTWLATSRRPLGVPGERRFLLEPFELPPPEVSLEEAESYAVVQLFTMRAREADARFRLTPDNVAEVVALCRAADGIPLAIELAAAQVRARTLAEIRKDLRGADAAVAWSYGLLDEPTRALLRHLALMPGGLSLRHARERLGHLVVDFTAAVELLVESNLVELAGADARLGMLETVREFCRAESRRRGEEDALWRLAASHLEVLVAKEDHALLDAEHDNLHAVLGWAVVQAPELAMRLAGRLAWYWYLRGHYEEGARWLDAALERAPAAIGEDRRRALAGAGRLALLRCQYARGEELLGESRNLAVALRDRRGEADAEQLLGSLARERGDHVAARRRHERALALFRELGDRREAARTRNYLTFLAWLSDDAGTPAQADPAWWRGGAEEEFRALGDQEGLVWALLNRGAIAHYAGDDPGALRAAFAESVGAHFQEGIAWALNLIGLTSLARGEQVQARAQLRASLRVHRRLGDLWRCASVLEALAALAAAHADAETAAYLIGGADALRRRIGAPVPRCERPLLDGAVERGEVLLGERFFAHHARGAALPFDELIELAVTPTGAG